MQFRFTRKSTALVLATLMFSFLASAALAAGLEFGTVHDKLNLNKHSQMEVKDYFKTVKGEEVTWSGVVKEIVSDRWRNEVRLTNSARSAPHGYNIVLNLNDRDQTAKLRRGQKITFTGVLSSYRNGIRGGVVIGVKKAELK